MVVFLIFCSPHLHINHKHLTCEVKQNAAAADCFERSYTANTLHKVAFHARPLYLIKLTIHCRRVLLRVRGKKYESALMNHLWPENINKRSKRLGYVEERIVE